MNVRCRPPHGGRGLKYYNLALILTLELSPSSRRAWIEISSLIPQGSSIFLLSPSSRRAWIEIQLSYPQARKKRLSPSSRRAWIEIIVTSTLHSDLKGSPSSRRAWIEINFGYHDKHPDGSPSSRRAWIEIDLVFAPTAVQRVALLTEGVD